MQFTVKKNANQDTTCQLMLACKEKGEI